MNDAASTLLIAAGVHPFAVDGQGHAGPLPRAVAVRGEEIIWTGVEPQDAPAMERTIDLGDAWITPAFVDAHVHGTQTGLALTGLDLRSASSATEVLTRVRQHAQGRSGVILGHGWDETAWPEGRPPSAAALSEASGGLPVLLDRVDVHSCLVDAATSEAVRAEHPAAPDASPGWLHERAAGAARRSVLAALPTEQLAAARAATVRHAASLGIASLHEMGHPDLSSLNDAREWGSGDWPLEVHVWWATLDIETCTARGLRPGGDLYLDGTIGARTAAVSGGYRDTRGDGELFHTDEEVATLFVDATRAGVGAGVHAIGDRAVDQAARGLEAAARIYGRDAVRRCRHRVEHLELVRPDHYARLATCGVVASVQPAFDALWGGPDGLYARRFGAEAACASNPFDELDHAGLTLAFGSDSTVTPLDPWGAVHAAEHHRGGHRLDRRRALAAHTLGGRVAAGQLATRDAVGDGAPGGRLPVGPVVPGARADLAAWSDDPFRTPEIRALSAVATMVAGRLVHAPHMA